MLAIADEDALRQRIGPSYQQIAHRWNAHLDTLTNEQIEFATAVLARAAELNAEDRRTCAVPAPRRPPSTIRRSSPGSTGTCMHGAGPQAHQGWLTHNPCCANGTFEL